MPENKESDFIATARKRFEQAADDEKLIREEALIDLKFVAGDQWNPSLKQDREAAGRPVMVFNRCHTFVQQVSNEARQNKPQIKFAKDDDKADDDTAEIYEGHARHIQYASDAQVAYETSVEYSAGGSFGFYRFVTEEDDDGKQELKIVPVLDPFAIYGILIASCFNREPRSAFVVEDMPKEEFKDTYTKSPITTGVLSESDSSWLSGQGWLGTDTVRIAEYWYCEGTGKNCKVKFCKISGMEVLPDTETEWMGYCIPIIPVLGKQMIIQGKPHLFSVIRFQRDAQRMINYTKTRIGETLAVSPISPFMVAEGQIKKGDEKWENLNRKVYPYLTYSPIDSGGKVIGPPQRDTFEPPIQALAAFSLQEIDDMKATAGIFDASLGQKSNETSGTAIRNRQQQANMTVMHIMDNLERSFKKGGLIMADLFPKIYDDARTIALMKADETPDTARINEQHDVGQGRMKHYKFGGDGAGKYRPIVTMARAFSTKRQESFDMMSEVVQGNPQVFPLVADLMFRNSDVAGGDELAERFKRMLPPQAQDPQNDDPEAQLQQAQSQLQQMQQQHQALNAYAQKLEKEQEGKVVENQAKAQIAQIQEMSRQEIVKMQEATKIAVAQITATKDANQAIADRELEQFKILHGTAHDAGMAAQQQSHEHAIADKQAAIASQQTDQQAANASDQSAQDHTQTLDAQQQAAALQPAAENSNE